MHTKRDQEIAAAIEAKRVILFFYNDEQRRVEPHTYGIDKKGHKALSGYQVNKGWRFFHADGMSRLTVTDETFLVPRPEYTRHDSRMERIWAQI